LQKKQELDTYCWKTNLWLKETRNVAGKKILQKKLAIAEQGIDIITETIYTTVNKEFSGGRNCRLCSCKAYTYSLKNENC
jgi:hypothetical protein